MSEKVTKKKEHEIARIKIRVEEKDRYIEKLKKDFDRVFNELKKLKNEQDKFSKGEIIGADNLSKVDKGGERIVGSVDSNPFLLKEY